MSQPLNALEKDPEIAHAIHQEETRQKTGLEMIASENYTSPAVMAAQGSVLTNKYAEGYPRKRYYGGCENVDTVEELALTRLRQLFHAEAANVQPHSGAQANTAVFFATLSPGDSFLGMDLSHGGHLTHGSPVNLSGKWFKAHAYGLNPETHRLDYDQIRDLVKRHQPKLLVAGASAYPRTIDFKTLGEITREAHIPLMVDMAHIAGLIAADLHPSPIPHAEYITSTTHKTLRGPRGGLILTREAHLKKINSAIFPGIQGGPLMHVIAAKAVAFGEALTPAFKNYQTRVIENAKTLADALLERGFELVTGGTDNHLMLLDLTRFKDSSVTGKDAEQWLDHAGITVNKNTVPNETRSPFVTSGIRIGTPALTTRGMFTEEMKQIAAWIEQALTSKGSEDTLNSIRAEVQSLCNQFPIFKEN